MTKNGAKNLYTTSTVCLFKITNLEKINEEISRKTGNEIVEDETDDIKEDGEEKEEPVEIFKKRVKEER